MRESVCVCVLVVIVRVMVPVLTMRVTTNITCLGRFLQRGECGVESCDIYLTHARESLGGGPAKVA